MEKSEILSIINYITVTPSELKSCGGRQHDILPIWDREKRLQRFELKPLLFHNGRYIYSPITIFRLQQLWKYGIPNFYLPYSVSLDNIRAVIDNWKKRYEKLMSSSIEDLFEKVGINNILKERELHEIYENYPNDVGDYDLLAIDDKNKVIWNIECKNIKKVGSIYEEWRQQNIFFKHKYDQKFIRRITALNENYQAILRCLNMAVDEYIIKSYMVTNKVFIPRLKEVSFPILSYDEMENLIKEFYNKE